MANIAPVDTTEQWSITERPRTLNEIIGNEDVKAICRGFIKKKRPPKCLLLAGQSGAGKTTLAFILARLLNGLKWDDPLTADIVDTNIGDERGINDVRGLAKLAMYSPQGRFRVLICDEIHALTPQARSTLLKPLEDGNSASRTVWILATDQPERLPGTVLRRCRKLVLRRPTVAETVAFLKDVVIDKAMPLKKSDNVDSLLEQIAVVAYCNISECLNILQNMADSLEGGSTVAVAFDQAVSIVMNVGAEKAAIKALAAIYLGKPEFVLATLRDTTDYNGFINRALDINGWLLDLWLPKPPQWAPPPRDKVLGIIKGKIKRPSLQQMSMVHEKLADTKQRMGLYLSESHLLVANLVPLAHKFEVAHGSRN